MRFVGTRDDVPEFMTVADGYVMSSAWEGMPMVLLEAAAAGLPIVATRVGGNPEVVEDGVSGFVVPPSDSDALAAAMLRLMALLRAPSAAAWGTRGHDHVREHYGLGRVVDRYEAVVPRACSGARVRPSRTRSCATPAGGAGGQRYTCRYCCRTSIRPRPSVFCSWQLPYIQSAAARPP